MQAANNPPEPALYASLIQCLWDSGVVSAQGQAAKLFTQGCRSGAVARCIHQTVGPDQTLEVSSLTGKGSGEVCSVELYTKNRP